ncbi:MAG: TonB-dependent receptor [Bacteroidales bacterium]|nr:TonB-dependent receptor [Bacteroidales bacterium]
MKRTLLYLLLMTWGILSAGSLNAQVLEGFVTDRVSGESLPGATVMVKGTTQGTVTGIDGDYRLSLDTGMYTITFSYVGYMTFEVDIAIESGETMVRNIQLQPDITTFEEFVVVGYGTQQKKVVTGAIATVDADDINATPILRIEQAMQGRAAGVQVTNLSGQPGEAPTVRIRGAGTTGNAEPLYVVDGMVVSGIDYLNPGDIESIDVLKDAASAAIYGARAANGVVLITTKRGTKGEMTLNYSFYQGIQNVARFVDVLNAEQYMMMMNEGARNAGNPEPFDLNEIPRHDTNWQKELFESNAPIANHELSVSGGSDRSTYASSLSYFTQQGIIGGDRSQFDRLTARLNTSHQVNDFIQFGNNLAYSHIIRRGIASNASFNAAYSSALNIDPLTPVFQEDEDILSQPPYSNQPVVTNSQGKVYGISEHIGAEIVNPLALLEIQTGETRVDKIVGNVFGEIEPMDNLKFRSSLGIDLAYVLDDSHQPLFFLNGAQYNLEKTSVQKNINRYFTWQFENLVSYSNTIDDHNFSILVGTTASKSNFENLYGFNADVDVSDPNHVYLNLATDTVWQAYGGASHSALLSLFGRVSYNYLARYAFDATIRRDGSSKFGPNNRFGTFPSFGVTWMISEENFFPSLGPLEVVKLRASWGINGNQEIGDYQFISTIDRSRGYIFGGGRAFGASPSYIANLDIMWEESEQIDIAVDFGAYDNRLTGTFDYYIKTTRGLLERIPIPGHVGNDPPWANVGSVENRGVEMSLNWRHYSRALRYSIGANAAYNKNKMTKIGNAEGVLPGASWAVAGMVTRTELGLPIAYFYGWATDGIFQNWNEVYQHINSQGQLLQPNARPGDVRFVDINGDGVINEDDRTMIGKPTPDWTFGMNANFEYRNFDLGFLVIGTYGNDVFNGIRRRDLNNTNLSTSMLDRWTGEGTSNTIPRFTFGDPNRNNRISDLYIEDASFIRLKNIQIGYTLPVNFLNRINAKTWRFYISAENLITLTRYSGADPEIGALSSFDIGIDRGIYPHARTFRLGTSISF